MDNITDIKIEFDGELIFMTVAKYKFFLSYGKAGREAKELYEHLQFTARLQQTSSIKATDVYLKKGLGWGNAKLKAAKSFLSKHGLIRYKQIRSKDGTFNNCYIEVATSANPENLENNKNTGGSKSDLADKKTEQNPAGGSINGPAVSRTSGSGKQMLNIISKCFNKEYKYILDHWNSKSILRNHREQTIYRQIAKRKLNKYINDLIQDYTAEGICKAIDNYCDIIKSKDHYWTYDKWTLLKFLEKGVDDFVDEADPFEAYKNNQSSVMQKPAVKDPYEVLEA